MSNLSLRQKELVRLLIEEKQFKPIKYFSEALKVSDKTLSKDIKFIEGYYKKSKFKIIRKPGVGIHLVIDNDEKINLINDINDKDEIFDPLSIANRRLEIQKLLLTKSNENTSIQKLADKYYVSKASIVNDLKIIEEYLNNYDIKLCKSVEGTKVIGTEISIRKAIASITGELANDKYCNPAKSTVSRLDAQTINGLANIFDMDLILYIEKILTGIEETLQLTIGETYYINLLTHILICIKRVSEGNQIKELSGDNLKTLHTDNIIYKSASDLASKIYTKYKIKINDSEVYYIYQYLVSSGFRQALLEGSSTVDKVYEIGYVDIANFIIKDVSEILNIDLTKDALLREGLMLHIQPMLNRIKYNIQIKNPLLQEILERFPKILSICQIVFHLIRKKYKLNSVSIDEIAYLATYFQAAIERRTSYKRVFVVCHSGYGTSQLLTTRLKKSFSQLIVVDVISEYKLKRSNLDDIDFIISTVNLDIKDKPYIFVSALLGEKDIKNIKSILLTDTYADKHKVLTFKTIEKLISENNIYINVEDKEVINKLKKANGEKLRLYKVSLGKEIEICLCENCINNNIALQIANDTAGRQGSIKFYILVSKYEEVKSVIKEVYCLSKSKNKISQLLKCKRVSEIKELSKKI